MWNLFSIFLKRYFNKFRHYTSQLKILMRTIHHGKAIINNVCMHDCRLRVSLWSHWDEWQKRNFVLWSHIGQSIGYHPQHVQVFKICKIVCWPRNERHIPTNVYVSITGFTDYKASIRIHSTNWNLFKGTLDGEDESWWWTLASLCYSTATRTSSRKNRELWGYKERSVNSK